MLAYRPLHVRAPIGLPHKSPLRKAAPDGKGRCFNAACTDFRLIKKDAAAIAGNRAGKPACTTAKDLSWRRAYTVQDYKLKILEIRQRKE